MNFALLLTIALGAILYVQADVVCFDKARTDAEWKQLKIECSEGVTETEPVEKKRIIVRCMLKKKGLLSEDLVLDYTKFKETLLDLAIDKKAEIGNLLQDCWDNRGTDENALLSFFLCYKEKLNELCPDSLKWDEDVE